MALKLFAPALLRKSPCNFRRAAINAATVQELMYKLRACGRRVEKEVDSEKLIRTESQSLTSTTAMLIKITTLPIWVMADQMSKVGRPPAYVHATTRYT